MFPDISGQLHTSEYKIMKKQMKKFQLNERVQGKLDKTNELILTTKADRKEGPDNI